MVATVLIFHSFCTKIMKEILNIRNFISYNFIVLVVVNYPLPKNIRICILG